MDHHLNAHVSATHNESNTFEPGKDQVQKPDGFERKTGRLATLKGLFTSLKAKMDHGRERASSALPPQRVHRGSLSSFASHIRRGSEAVRHVGRSRSRSAAPFDHLVVKPEAEKQYNIDRHTRLQTAIKTLPNSPFQQLSKNQRMHLLSALDVCTGLSDEAAVSREGLMLLDQCLDELTRQFTKSESTDRRPSSDEYGLQSELKKLRDDCNNRLAALINEVQSSTHPNKAEAAQSGSLKSSGPIPQQDDSVQNQQPLPVAGSNKPLDQKTSMPQKVTPVDPATAEISDLDLRTLDMKKELSQLDATSLAPSGPTTGEFDDLDRLALDINKELSQLDDTSRTPSGPTTAEFDDLDQLALDINNEISQLDATSPVSGNSTTAEFDATDLQAMDLNKPVGKADVTKATDVELAELDKELAELEALIDKPDASVPVPVDPASNENTTAHSGISSPPTPDQRA